MYQYPNKDYLLSTTPLFPVPKPFGHLPSLPPSAGTSRPNPTGSSLPSLLHPREREKTTEYTNSDSRHVPLQYCTYQRSAQHAMLSTSTTTYNVSASSSCRPCRACGALLCRGTYRMHHLVVARWTAPHSLPGHEHRILGPSGHIRRHLSMRNPCSESTRMPHLEAGQTWAHYGHVFHTMMPTASSSAPACHVLHRLMLAN